jgi:MarR family transcriptional regulator for hemolysin
MGSTAAANGSKASTAAPSHELDAPPWLRVESTLMATAQAIRDAYDVKLSPLGLTLSLASLLCYVAEFGPVNQTRAAEHLGQGRAATGAQVDRLQELGYVERRPDPDDRRVWMVAITPAGLERAAEVGEVDTVFRSELRAGISRQERQQLAAVLLRLQSNVAVAIHGAHATGNPPLTNKERP